MQGDHVKGQTICWNCRKATGRCSWSNYWEHSPVPGWVAEPTKLKINRGVYMDSYCVISCPEFERDGRK